MENRSVFAGLLSIALAAVLLVGCTNRIEPARKAVAEVEAALAAAGTDATKYIPGRYQVVEKQLEDLKAAFERQDYSSVLAAAPAALASAQALAAEAAQAKEAALAEWAAEWADLSSSVPAALAAIDSRLGILARARALPGGMTAEQLETAHTRLTGANTLWSRATVAQAGGDLEQAVALALAAKERTDDLLASLAMSAG